MARESMKKKRAEKTRHIIEIATEVFAEKGYHGALTDDIAERAGISKRSMYYYIGDKDMLYEAVWNNLVSQLTESLYSELDKIKSPEKKLYRMIQAMGQLGKMRQLHSIALREIFAGGESLPKSLLRDTDRMISQFVSISEQIKSNNNKVDSPPIIIAWMVFSFYVYWENVTPIIVKKDEAVQLKAVESVGVGINDNVIQEVSKLVFKMLGLKYSEGLNS